MADKLDLVFKKAVSRQYTSLNKKWYEETGGAGFKLKGSDIWVEPIPGTAQAIANRIVYYDKLILTEDLTVANHKAWLAYEAGSRIGGFVPPRYGSTWGVQLFNASNVEILTTDAIGWFWDYETGILTFDNTASAGPYKVTCYRYIGTTADDMLKMDSTLGNLLITPGDTIS